MGATSDVMFYGASFDGGYNKEVYYIGNQMMGSRSAFPRPHGNQGRNKNSRWRDCTRANQPQVGVGRTVMEISIFHLMIG